MKTMHQLRFIGFSAALALAGCGQAEVDGPPTGDDGGAHVVIGVAPLTLSGVTDACYTLSVQAGTAAAAPVVWTRRVCSSQYGDGQGALSYVGTCDASVSGLSTVRLVMEDLCTGGACGETTPGPHSLSASAWRNPCAGPDGCTRQALCEPQKDTPVDFDLTVARAANQGFFDVAVEFDDIFCSAKLDCLDSQGGPLKLLFDPDTGARGQTVVVAWACTAGIGAETWLYEDNLVVSCFDEDTGEPLGSWAYDPSLGPGNAGPGQAPFVFETGIYRTVTESTGVSSWNVALGVRPEELPGRCVLAGRGTASGTAFADGETPDGAVYPYVSWNVTLSEQAAALSCGKHALDVADSGVTTEYVRDGAKKFSHQMRGTPDAPVASVGRSACTATIASLDGQVSFATSPEGVTARIGRKQSGFYKLPAGRFLGGCCGDPCCEAP